MRPFGIRKRLWTWSLIAPAVLLAAQGAFASDPDDDEPSLLCPDGYVLSEGIFSDGGLFDNLPIGLARMLAERHVDAESNPLPVFLGSYTLYFPRKYAFPWM